MDALLAAAVNMGPSSSSSSAPAPSLSGKLSAAGLHLLIGTMQEKITSLAGEAEAKKLTLENVENDIAKLNPELQSLIANVREYEELIKGCKEKIKDCETRLNAADLKRKKAVSEYDEIVAESDIFQKDLDALLSENSSVGSFSFDSPSKGHKGDDGVAPMEVSSSSSSSSSSRPKRARSAPIYLDAPEEAEGSAAKKSRASRSASSEASLESSYHDSSLLRELYPNGTPVYYQGKKAEITGYNQETAEFTIKLLSGETIDADQSKLCYLPEKDTERFLIRESKKGGDEEERYYEAKLKRNRQLREGAPVIITIEWIDYGTESNKTLSSLDRILPIRADSAFAQSLKKESVEFDDPDRVGTGFFLKKAAS